MTTSSASASSTRESEISTELKDLEKVSTDIIDIATTLRGRLASVTITEDDADENMPCRELPAVPLSREIRESSDRISEARSILWSILERLEL